LNAQLQSLKDAKAATEADLKETQTNLNNTEASLKEKEALLAE
jgi:septal ring factor EnvC (AmiA/AmiB activator)